MTRSPVIGNQGKHLIPIILLLKVLQIGDTEANIVVWIGKLV
jgi:hypothetical protein